MAANSTWANDRDKDKRQVPTGDPTSPNQIPPKTPGGDSHEPGTDAPPDEGGGVNTGKSSL
jgi:hypothetical protein